MERAFSVADEYRAKFEPYRIFFEENDQLDVVTMQEEDHGNT